MVLTPSRSGFGLLMTFVTPALLLVPVTAGPAASQGIHRASATAVSPAARPAAAVVDGFHRALARGDTKAALSHLADDALIFESGGIERGKQEYASHHLAADAAFSQAVPSKVTRRVGHVTGTTAWIASEGRSAGTFNGKAVDRTIVETMVLRSTGANWKIVHIHWSSAPAGGK